MSKPDFNDYESTGQWMIATIIAGRIEDYDLKKPFPSQKEISDAIDGANAGTSLGEYIGAAWEAAAEVVYDMFPQFRDPDSCLHDKVGREDDGLGRRWLACVDCGEEVTLSDPDEDGKTYWEVVS